MELDLKGWLETAMAAGTGAVSVGTLVLWVFREKLSAWVVERIRASAEAGEWVDRRIETHQRDRVAQLEELREALAAVEEKVAQAKEERAVIVRTLENIAENIRRDGERVTRAVEALQKSVVENGEKTATLVGKVDALKR